MRGFLVDIHDSSCENFHDVCDRIAECQHHVLVRREVLPPEKHQDLGYRMAFVHDKVPFGEDGVLFGGLVV